VRPGQVQSEAEPSVDRLVGPVDAGLIALKA